MELVLLVTLLITELTLEMVAAAEDVFELLELLEDLLPEEDFELVAAFVRALRVLAGLVGL